MNTAIDNSGPAFPTNKSNTNVGITLRDYFAIKALQGICASSPTKDYTDEILAQEAYNLADAMIKNRNKT